ncbi:CHAT domain-containing protein [Corallococcus sp. CA053C]|uniref:CHAT domain-containing protein n=1 Tax=Corallococcus sp. CA053C TaxID=2316732 RepID=UPI000EA3F8A3|nr:CHAT domain-containing protein [Corallococcus sp. CA053C]RKH13104.1 CHAT domain-containing protein [Corallococcus sp. CA053C]
MADRQDSPQGTRPPRRTGLGRAGFWLGLALCMAVGFGAVRYGKQRGAGPEAASLWLSDLPTRPLEVRLAHPAADVHRRFVAPVEPGLAARPVPLGALSRLEDRGDAYGVAISYLLHGYTEQALAHLSHVPPSPDKDTAHAAAALLRGHHDEALELLDSTLEAEPQHPQARWNRAVLMRELGLSLVAATTFEEVAAQGEPGWSDEAREQARSLRARFQERADAWKATREVLLARLRTPDAPLPVESISRFPGLARERVYDLLGAAEDAARVRELLPLAQALDHVSGGRALEDTVQRMAALDFTRRAPLAREYAKLVLEEHPSPASLIERLRQEETARDLLLGALLRTPSVARTQEELRALTRDVTDPWILSRVEQEGARLDDLAGQGAQAGDRLRAALTGCRENKLPLRCVDVLMRLSQRATASNRMVEGEESARAAWQEAAALGEWEREGAALVMLANATRFQRRVAVSRAYLNESLARQPDDCMARTQAHRNLASLALMRFRPQEARNELEAALACGQTPGLQGAWILADLARLDPRPSDEARLRAELARVTPLTENPGRRVLATLIEGRFAVARDWRQGQQVLRRAIAEAEPLLRASADARDARVVAFQTLAVSAGHAGAFREALDVVAESLQVPVPEGCVLAAAVEDERTVTVVRGLQGQVRGHYDASRTRPLRDDLTGLVPPELVALLRDCPRVAVLAAPPLDSRAGILPPDLAWSYRVGTGAQAPPPTKPPLHVVVSDVEPPASLRLARLPSAADSDLEGAQRLLRLKGAQATPERVLEAMEQATDIDIHAHGVVDRALSDATVIALSPQQDGHYALTAEELRRRHLHGAPLVVLGACSAARLAPILHQTSSLPQAFLASGARAVFAATADIPNDAGAFFRGVRERIQAGTEPSQALRAERLEWRRQQPGTSWVDKVLLYQ